MSPNTLSSFILAAWRSMLCVLFIHSALCLSRVEAEDVDIVDRGISAYEEERYDEAIKIFSEAIRKKEDPDGMALFYRGITYLAKQEAKLAGQDFSAYHEIDPEDLESIQDIAGEYYNVESFEEALEWYEKGLKKSPEYLPLLYDRATCLHRLHRFKEALTDIRKVEARNPEYPNMFFGKAEVLALLDKRQEAIAAYGEHLKREPKDADAMSNRGLLYYHENESSAALKDFNSALRIDPDHAVALGNRSLVYEYLGELKAALSDINRAIKLLPERPYLKKQRGDIRFAMENFDGALSDYEAVLALDPNFADALEGKASVLEKKGRTKEVAEIRARIKTIMNSDNYETEQRKRLTIFGTEGSSASPSTPPVSTTPASQ